MKRIYALFSSLIMLAILPSFSIKTEGKFPNFLTDKFVEIESGDVHVYKKAHVKGFEIEGSDTEAPLIKKVPAFYISKHEVSNAEYSEFLNAIKAVDNQEFYELVRIDTSGWMNSVEYPTRYMEYYHSHPAYANYPVVNISHEGAKAYCEWLSAKASRGLPANESVTFRLPTKEEWLRASRGDNHQYTYAWGQGGVYASNGLKMCNFKEVEKSNSQSRYNNRRKKTVVVGTMNRLKSNVSVTKPIESFDANSFGVFNMNGNVAEMVREKSVALGGSWADSEEDVTLESELEYNTSSPFVGFRPVMIMN